jgi:hypothetical protein
MSDPDDLPDDDAAMDQFVEDFERHRDAIYELICDYMEDADINEGYVAPLLADAAIRMRMTAYGLGVENPSVAGLKLDLDRLRNELNEFLREAKKGAEEFIGHVKELRAAADAALDAEEDEDGESEEKEENPE